MKIARSLLLAATLLTPLAVDPHSDQIRGIQLLPNTHVGPTQHGKLLDGIADVHLAVLEATRPEILIVARQRGAIVGQDHAEPEAAHELGVRQMLDDFANRPLAGSF